VQAQAVVNGDGERPSIAKQRQQNHLSSTAWSIINDRKKTYHFDLFYTSNTLVHAPLDLVQLHMVQK
jgi:hypothetical protein